MDISAGFMLKIPDSAGIETSIPVLEVSQRPNSGQAGIPVG